MDIIPYELFYKSTLETPVVGIKQHYKTYSSPKEYLEVAFKPNNTGKQIKVRASLFVSMPYYGFLEFVQSK